MGFGDVVDDVMEGSELKRSGGEWGVDFRVRVR
jgi:hypothetical protein